MIPSPHRPYQPHRAKRPYRPHKTPSSEALLIFPIKRSVTHLPHQAKRYPSLPSSVSAPIYPSPYHLLQRTISRKKGLDLAYHAKLISCQKGLGLVYRKRRTPRDSTLKYSPRGLTFSDGPRMTPYHNKLLGWAHNNLRKVTICKNLLSHSLHVVVGDALNQLEVILLVVVALIVPTCDS